MEKNGQIGVQPTFPLGEYSDADWTGFLSAIAGPGIAEGKHLVLLPGIELRFLGQAHSLVIILSEAFLRIDNFNYGHIRIFWFPRRFN